MRSTPSAARGPRAASYSAQRSVVPPAELVSVLRPRRTHHTVLRLSPSSSIPRLAHSRQSIGHSCPLFSASAACRSSRAPQGSSLMHVGAFGFSQLRSPASHLTPHDSTPRHGPETRSAERRQPHGSESLLARIHTHRGLTRACSGLVHERVLSRSSSRGRAAVENAQRFPRAVGSRPARTSIQWRWPFAGFP